MSFKKTIVITGINGYIGKHIKTKLREIGHEVWGLDVGKSEDKKILRVNLNNFDELKKARNLLPVFDILIHTAALAHGQKPVNGETIISINTKITRNLIKIFNQTKLYFIFLSSVSVYGEAGRISFVNINDKLRPSTDYGMSKVICEKYIIRSSYQKYTILRLAPVFGKGRMQDLSKRVYFPGLPKIIKMVITPPPKYSLTSLETIEKTILKLVLIENQTNSILNITDSKLYEQKELVKWFTGIELPIPVILTKPILLLSYFLPKKYGYKIRCNYYKLFKPTLYK